MQTFLSGVIILSILLLIQVSILHGIFLNRFYNSNSVFFLIILFIHL